MNARNWLHPSRFLFLVLVLALGSNVPAAAQSRVSVRGNVGASFFQSPDRPSELLNSGTGFGLEADVRVYRGLSVAVGGGYDSFTLNEDNARSVSSGGSDLAFLYGTLGLRYTYVNDTDAHPYLSVGVGRYQLRSTNRRSLENGELTRAGDRTTEDEGGVHLAVGSEFRLDDTYSVFFEPRYMFFDINGGRDDRARFFTLRLGVDIQL